MTTYLMSFVAGVRINPWRAVLLVAAAVSLPLFLTAQENTAGKVNFVIRTDPQFDVYLQSPDSGLKQWFQANVWRMMVYSPFFDNKLTWYPNGWAYINLYGLHIDSSVVSQHPEWLLRDSRNNPLYIPYNCSNGSCPLYAADVSNPQYRAHWIARARQLVAKGYRGLWVDDVNLEFRVSDGLGKQAVPLDPSTERGMTYQAWKENIAAFCEEIRAAFPDIEILHNSIWYAGGPRRDSDPSVARVIRAADYINLERGVADRGLTGGEGEWSLDAFLRYIDRVHTQGKAVIIDNTDSFGEYGLAAYYLISSGRDGLGGHDVTPDHWPAALDVDLGPALGPRSRVGGVFRREFERGVVMLNEPRAQPATVPTCPVCLGLDRRPTSAVKLMAGQGAIIMRGNTRPAR